MVCRSRAFHKRRLLLPGLTPGQLFPEEESLRGLFRLFRESRPILPVRHDL